MSAPSPPIRDAATVMLVRDTEGGLEVFLLRRNLRSVFVGGAYVFPGGAVDEADRHTDLEAVCEGRSDHEASALLGVERGGLAFWVAAVRECFEEAGILLAYDDDGAVVSLADAEVAERFRLHRVGVDGGERRLIEVCAAEHLRLAVDQMHYFGRWITPAGAPRRYDTRFFLTAAPRQQVPLHDDRETIANVWIAPAGALAQQRAGEIELILPTIRSLEAIARFDTSTALLAAANAANADPAHPLIRVDNGIRILLPGDPGYEGAVSRRALDG